VAGSGLFFKQFRAVRVLTIASQLRITSEIRMVKQGEIGENVYFAIFLLPLFCILLMRLNIRERDGFKPVSFFFAEKKGVLLVH